MGKHMAREMTPQERAAAPVEVRQALADKVKNLIVSNLTHEENQLWLANVDAFEERAYQRGRRAALLECLEVAKECAKERRKEEAKYSEYVKNDPRSIWASCRASEAEIIAAKLDRLAQEG